MALDGHRRIGDQVQSGEILTAVVGLNQVDVDEHVAALRSSEVGKRYRAAEALADLGARAQSARSALERVLQQDPHALVRKSAALALGLLHSSEAEPCLQEAAQHDECQFVRKRAMEALGELGVKSRL